MSPQFIADGIVLVHFGYVVLVVVGGLLVLRYPRFAWVHVPAVVWATVVMAFGWTCPLTPFENHFRQLAGTGGYQGGFIDRYIVSVLYPAGLTRTHQIALGIGAAALNATVYATWFFKSRRAA